MTMLRLQAQPLTSEPEGRLVARLVPFGEAIDHEGRTVQFSRGQIDHSGHVPVNVDHSGAIAAQVGKAHRFMEADDGLYADIQLSDTQLGRDVLTLLRDGVVEDVSIGIYRNDDGTGVLDHVAIVDRGAFGKAATPSKVLAVHSAESKGDPTVEQTDEPTPSVESYDDTEVRDEITALRESVAGLALPGAVNEPAPALTERIQALALEGGGVMEFALDAEDTTTVAGLVPDYQSSEVIAVIADGRPFISSLPRDGIGNAGMTIDYPIVTAPGSVDVQATENLEVASAPFEVGTQAHDLLTFAGANILSRQLVERSAPSALQTYLRVMGGNYADATELHATNVTSAAAVAAGNTAIVADLGASAAATFAAISAGASEIASDVRRPATHMVLGADRWTQMMSLADTDGRPLLTFPANGPSNAAGQSGFNQMTAQYHGLTVLYSPAAAATMCLIYSDERSAAWLEQNPVDLRAEVVSTLSWEVGIYGLGVCAPKYVSGAYSITAI